MKHDRKYYWLLFYLLFVCFGRNVRSEQVEELYENTQNETINNEMIAEFLNLPFSEYLHNLCGLGIQFLVPNPVCASQLEYICKRNDILIQMLDASSKYPGMLNGARFDYGNFDQCIKINYEYGYGRLKGKYCPFSLLIPDAETGLSNWDNIYKLSLCIPDGCSLKMFSNISSKLKEDQIEELENLCVTKESFDELSLGNIVIMSILMVWCGVILICTLYDVYLYTTEQSYEDKIVTSLSMFRNFEKLIEIDAKSPNRVEILDGVRAISMVWIIAGHGFSSWIDRFPYVNRDDLVELHESISSSYASAAHLAVDTFFYMSGFLAAFSYLKSEAKPLMRQIKSIPAFYFHRYIRLTISTCIFFLVCVWIYPKIGKGPVWIPYTNREVENCKKYWWTFFLYIQNYYNYKELCVIPTWYLSADMQMYILSPLLLIPLSILLSRRPKLAVSMLLLFMLNILLTIFPMMIRYNKEPENTFDTHSRLISYSMGITMGALMQKTKAIPYLSFIDKRNLKTFSLLVWSIVLTLMFLLVLLYVPADITKNRNFNILYFGLSKPAWCIGLSWMVYSCHHGYGGVVNWILTRPMLKILSKLSYPMYLIHYAVIGHYILSLRTRIFFSHYHEFHLFCGYFVETLLDAFLWSLIFDYPIYGILNGVQRKKIKPKDSK